MMQNNENPAFNYLEAILSGDTALRNRAYRLLLDNKTIRAKIASWCVQYRQTTMAPDDILQESLLKMDDVILEGRFQGRCSVPTFLLSIAFNVVRDASKLAKPIEYKENIGDEDWKKPESLADCLVFVEEDHAVSELDKALATLISRLDDACRRALTLQYYQEMSMKQIQAQTGYANPKKKASECRKKLRKLCQADPAVQRLSRFLNVPMLK